MLSIQAVRGLNAEDAAQVAELMAHEPQTQMQYYVASQATREKVRAVALLSSVMTVSKYSNSCVLT